MKRHRTVGWVEARGDGLGPAIAARARRNPPFCRWWVSACQAAFPLNKRSVTPQPTLQAPLQRAAKDRAGGPLVERKRIAGGGRVLHRHGDDAVEPDVAALSPGR